MGETPLQLITMKRKYKTFARMQNAITRAYEKMTVESVSWFYDSDFDFWQLKIN